MDVLNALHYVQTLARELREFDNIENSLKKSYKEPVPLRKVNEVEPEPVEPQKKFVAFAFSEIILAVFINKVLSFLLSYISNGFMTYKQFVEAGYIGYRNITLFWPVGAVLAIPVALIVAKVIMGILRSKSSQQYTQMLKEKKEADRENIEIQKNNETIHIHNSQITAKIQEVGREKARLLQTLRENAPWYPEAYFSLDAVDFAIRQISAGKAKTVNEALVQYIADSEN